MERPGSSVHERIAGIKLALTHRFRRIALAVVAIAAASPSLAQTAAGRIDDALQNITILVRPDKVGYAAVWDGNRYVQCRRLPDRALRCEAAGTTLQPSLRNDLTGDRLSRLAALGWILDPAFGNYVQTFPADMPSARIADHVVRTLGEGYGVTTDNLETRTMWVVDAPCPPRNGPGQNLAGLVNDMPAMRRSALTGCAYVPPSQAPQPAGSPAELIALYGTSVTAEIQRLRINSSRRVHVVFGAGIGYVQCMPETPSPAIYCEAQSAESWPALAAVLTPDRTSRLRSRGYADPGRSPNYWKSYPVAAFSDVAIADEILTILHDIYGYTGTAKLKISTE